MSDDSDPLHEPTPEQKAAALAELKAALRRPVPSVPQAELDLLRGVALEKGSVPGSVPRVLELGSTPNN